MPRHPTRYGLPQVRSAVHHQLVTDWLLRDGKTYYEDRDLGTRRARAALLMELGLPGSVYLYQGEELGLFEVADIPWGALEDPEAAMTSHGDAIKGRDGCRVPLPWKAVDESGDFGFSAPVDHAPAHLPQPEWFAQYAVDVEETEQRLHAQVLPPRARRAHRAAHGHRRHLAHVGRGLRRPGHRLRAAP